MNRPPRATTAVQVVAVRPDRHLDLPETLVTEEPLEIRAAGPGREAEPVAVTMRTPGHDFELAAGYLVTEGLVRPDEVLAVGYCDAADPENRWNTVTVSLPRHLDASARRANPATASCGVCGKESIDQVELACPVVPPGRPVAAALVSELPDRLRTGQAVFERTGGLHAAGIFTTDGDVRVVREDVGRHNAVDKVIGHRVLDRTSDPDATVLVVSGRVSFEIVQKAAMAGLGLLVAVSAPSSLAISAAERLGVTVAAFVRNGRYNVYSHPGRIDFSAR